jgi:hypothetical protein
MAAIPTVRKPIVLSCGLDSTFVGMNILNFRSLSMS